MPKDIKMELFRILNECPRTFDVTCRDANPENDNGLGDSPEQYCVIEGMAATYGSEYVMYEDRKTHERIVETIERGAFDNADENKVLLTLNHDVNAIPYAVTTNRTLILENREDGLFFRAYLRKDNTEHMKLYSAIKDGYIGKCSFMCQRNEDNIEYRHDDGGDYKTIIKRIDKMYDVSVVNFPAYENTSVVSRCANLMKEENEEVAELEKRKAIEEEKRKSLIAKIRSYREV